MKKEKFTSNNGNKISNLEGIKLKKFPEDNKWKNFNIKKKNFNEESKNKNFEYIKIKNIKSLYIRKIIFSLIDEKVRLNMIKYSKYF